MKSLSRVGCKCFSQRIPSVLGIKPIPNIQRKISDMIKKYRAETIDIGDVEFEEPDLELDSLFPLNNNTQNNDGEEDLL